MHPNKQTPKKTIRTHGKITSHFGTPIHPVRRRCSSLNWRCQSFVVAPGRTGASAPQFRGVISPWVLRWAPGPRCPVTLSLNKDSFRPSRQQNSTPSSSSIDDTVSSFKSEISITRRRTRGIHPQRASDGQRFQLSHKILICRYPVPRRTERNSRRSPPIYGPGWQNPHQWRDFRR
jgi:hypothetical protein